MHQPPLSADDVRRKYLEFFRSKAHLVYPSASLKSDDPTVMFNVAGMQQFKPYFQGATPRFPGASGVWPRVTTSQKCMRAGGKDSDIENVGRTRRHHTFFEMLGNFSFGDYFKREAIAWAWEFLTSPEWLGLDPERLYATVYRDDDEAYDIWANEVGIPKERLSRFGEDENFWPANAIKDERSGPCGPCSEVFYDRGPAFGSPDETGPNTGSGDRYMEIWNLVFTQFNLEGGVLTPLPNKNIDTGGGLERFATIMSEANDAYGTELFQPIIRRLVELSGVPYNDIASVQHRIIADHVRSVSMCILDGVLPANDGAGYVIKMLIRRASRQAYLLGLREPVLYRLVDGVAEAMGEAYPELEGARERVSSIVKGEEEGFLRTLESGIARVGTLLERHRGEVLPGDVAFDLWQTYGFPLDLTEEMAEERGVSVDREGFERARAAARETSRTHSASASTSVFSVMKSAGRVYGETEFLGYNQLDAQVEVKNIEQLDGEEKTKLIEGERAQVALEQTPFYAEGGGQIGDIGALEWQGGKAVVKNAFRHKTNPNLIWHDITVLRGALEVGQPIRAVVDPIRAETEKHHTATHLLHAALRSLLGTHVAQAGSLVSPERLRFDFSHPKALTEAELGRIEARVNRWIQGDLRVSWQTVTLEAARKAGAMMLFGEKYGSEVRMVTVSPEEGSQASVNNSISTELCGGTHVQRTGTLGLFVITAEEAVSAGVRRLEALTGEAALAFVRETRGALHAAAKSLGAKPDEVALRLEKLQSDLRAAQREAATLRDKLAAAQMAKHDPSSGTGSEIKEAGGFRYSVVQLGGVDAGALRNAADTLLERSGADIVVLASGPLLVAKVGKDAEARGAHAGKLVGEIAKRAGGGGGGRPNLAQAGVKDPAKLAEALGALPEILGG